MQVIPEERSPLDGHAPPIRGISRIDAKLFAIISVSSKVCGVTTERAPHASENGNPVRKFRRNGATCAFRTNCLAINSGRRRSDP
jgi:hypothetical protein